MESSKEIQSEAMMKQSIQLRAFSSTFRMTLAMMKQSIQLRAFSSTFRRTLDGLADEDSNLTEQDTSESRDRVTTPLSPAEAMQLNNGLKKQTAEDLSQKELEKNNNVLQELLARQDRIYIAYVVESVKFTNDTGLVRSIIVKFDPLNVEYAMTVDGKANTGYVTCPERSTKTRKILKMKLQAQKIPETFGGKHTPNEGHQRSKTSVSVSGIATEVLGSRKYDKQSAEEFLALKRMLMCKVCLDEELCIIFLPCRHMATCERCARVLDNCPVCRSPIEDSLKINYE